MALGIAAARAAIAAAYDHQRGKSAAREFDRLAVEAVRGRLPQRLRVAWRAVADQSEGITLRTGRPDQQRFKTAMARPHRDAHILAIAIIGRGRTCRGERDEEAEQRGRSHRSSLIVHPFLGAARVEDWR